MEDALKEKQESRAALLLVMAANLFTSISRKSITNDEIVPIPAGYYHLVAGKFQLDNEALIGNSVYVYRPQD